MTRSAAAGAAPVWAPLRRHATFRRLWSASVVSNVGTWMQNVGAVWLMTSLTPSPLFIALVQTATSAPVFLLGLPGGALADVVDRRRLLIVAQAWMAVAAAVLGVLALAGHATPGTILAFTFAIGIGSAVSAPGWQAIMPELVPRVDLASAIALNSAGVNIARAVGPALGGLIVLGAGAGAVFLLNAASFLGVIAALLAWPRPARAAALPPEHLPAAIRAGVRYVRYAPAYRAVLVRCGLFVFSAAAVWALLPVVAQQQLGLGAGGYGTLLGCLGAGAVLGAAVLPRLRASISIERLVDSATVVYAVATAVLAFVPSVVAAGLAMLVTGVAWISVMASFNVGAQTAAPAWVSARALGAYMLVFQGAMAVGSAMWGLVAGDVGTTTALLVASAGLAASLAASRWWALGPELEPDLTPSLHWAEPVVAEELEPEDGPVVVMIEYRIDPERWREFVTVTRDLARIRYRDGAMRWGLLRDTADPARCVEHFMVRSWAEHLRQHERVTVADRVTENRVRAFHVGAEPVRVSHWIDVSRLRASDDS